MAYIVVIEGKKNVRRLVGPRPLAELLTHDELLLVEEGYELKADYWAGIAASILAYRVVPCIDCDGTGSADNTDAFARHVLETQTRSGANGHMFERITQTGLRRGVPSIESLRRIDR